MRASVNAGALSPGRGKKGGAMNARLLAAVALVMLVDVFPVAQAATGTRTASSAMQRVVSENPSFVLYKPETWKLQHSAVGETLHLSVASPDGKSIAEVDFADNRKRRLDAQQWMTQHIGELRKRYPDLTVSASSVCKDQPASCAVASLSYSASGTAMQGRFFFHGDDKLTTVRSYRAPVARMEQDRALLLDVLTNIHVRAVQPIAVQFVRRQAADGSLSIELPSDWGFLAHKGSIVAGAPQGRSGFVFTAFSVMPQNYGVATQPGVIIAPYRPPATFIYDIFAQFKNRQTRVLATQPDAQTAAQCPAQIGRACDVADVQVSWVSPEGVPCLGGFKLLNAHPNLVGHWFSIVAGVWGPADDLTRHLPLLERTAASFSINDAYAKRYIAQGLAHLRQMQARTRQAIQELYGAIEQNQRDYESRSATKEASDAKWDDYARGNSYWVSDLEGGKVYQTDPWGTRDTDSGTRYDGPPHNYIHFEGQNPAHPSEHMREISSYDLKKMNR
jgi:hypothetical protein